MKIEDYKKAKISRTQSYIINAMLKLLKEFPYEVITITEICQEADVARVTFYRNFETQENVLRRYIKILVDDYFEELKQNIQIDFELLARTYFEHWFRKKELLILLKKNNLEKLLLEEYSIVEQYLNDIIMSNPNYPTPTLSNVELLYTQSYNFSGLWRILFMWVERDFLETVEEMYDILCNIKYGKQILF